MICTILQEDMIIFKVIKEVWVLSSKIKNTIKLIPLGMGIKRISKKEEVLRKLMIQITKKIREKISIRNF